MDTNEKATKEMTEKEYVSCWSLNAMQHFHDGDYVWICDFIKNMLGIVMA